MKTWLELEHKAVTGNPFRQKAANVITEATSQAPATADAANHR